VLLARRHRDRTYYPGVWDIIGGHCEEAERPTDALRRELHEELGIVAMRFTEIGAFPEPSPEKHGEGRHHVFVITEWSGTPANLRPDEHESIGWFSRRELQEIELASREYIRILEAAFAS
jgi:8-oxo-dGTP diphosphatase